MSRAMPYVIAAAIIAILVGKLLQVRRINVNWDEFHYLSNVYALARGELHLLLQGAYTHLFRWAATPGVNEVDQIVEIRLLMWPLLALSAWLLYRLARRWTSPSAAAFAVLAFVSTWPVLKHGASFRADSMLLPLTLATLVLATRRTGRRAWNDVAAGLCLGIAFALTTKSVLMVPLLLAMIVLPDATQEAPAHQSSPGSTIRRLAWLLVAAGLLAAALIAGHSTQLTAGAESAGSFAVRTVTATLVEVPFLPRGDYFIRLAMEDPVYWLALVAGLFVAIRRGAFTAAACILALLPILFYRNAFPYYYPVMMAPAAILVALAADWILHEPSQGGPRRYGIPALAALGLLLLHQAWDGLMSLRFDEQDRQRRVVAAVHQVFPAAVPYIDHSGMIASFPKANFLMSSWGVESYRRQGRDFMPDLLANLRPPLLLVNHPVLQSGSLLFRQLSATDQKLLESSYVDYWGPIRVAGVEVTLPAEGSIAVRVPFPGAYRVECSEPVRLDGVSFSDGEVLTIVASQPEVMASAAQAGQAPRLRLVWAEARTPPQEAAPRPPLYLPL